MMEHARLLSFLQLFLLVASMGGIMLTVLWLWMRPKVMSAVKEEIEECKDTRICLPGGALMIQLDSISSKIDTVIGDQKYMRKRLDDHINNE